MFNETLFVPNVPCGVESEKGQLLKNLRGLVPNVPCGVESYYLILCVIVKRLFLMYRVELKVIISDAFFSRSILRS